MKTRRVVMTALMAAVLYAVQIALAFLPNIELVSLLILLYAAVFPRETIPAVYIFALLQGITYGFGLWWIMYLYVWPILALVAWLLRRNTSPWLWAVVSGGFGLCFGALCSIPYLFIGGWAAAVSSWVMGIPFDVAHCVGNVVVALLLYKPLYKALTMLKRNAFGEASHKRGSPDHLP